jgi:CIC family chloride channel protein
VPEPPTPMSPARPHQEAVAPRPLGALPMAALAVVVGIGAGAGAILFRKLIAFVHDLLFLGDLAFTYDANLHTPESPWGPWVVLVPVVGALGVAFLVKNFAPEARGHGVPEVMDAIYHGEGRIRPVVAVIKSLASALSIGSGGSVGREGPIAQIGSALGSALGQWIPMSLSQRVTLIAAGAAGGIAATFNTPIGGLAFAIELLLPSITPLTVTCVAFSTVTATYIGRSFLGLQPAFQVPALVMKQTHLQPPAAFLAFLALGLLLGLLATLFVRSIYWFEDRFEQMPGNYYTRHTLGMLGVGVTMYVVFRLTGRYYVEGVGYAAIEDVLRGSLSLPLLLLVLVGLKLLVTCLTLGSGASGSIFSPSLFMGAMAGGAFGVVVSGLFPGLGVGIPAFAIVGMAAMIAGSTGAVMTAITMLFEMTRDYNVALPVIVAVVVAYLVRKNLSYESIYTLKLLRRNHVVPEGLEAALAAARQARHVMSREFVVVPANAGPDSWPRPPAADRELLVLVERGGELVDVRRAQPEELLRPPSTPERLSRVRYVLVSERGGLRELLAEFLAEGASLAVVTRVPGSRRVGDITGVIERAQLASLTRTDAAIFG